MFRRSTNGETIREKFLRRRIGKRVVLCIWIVVLVLVLFVSPVPRTSIASYFIVGWFFIGVIAFLWRAFDRCPNCHNFIDLKPASYGVFVVTLEVPSRCHYCGYDFDLPMQP
jgi:hypothetical protein